MTGRQQADRQPADRQQADRQRHGSAINARRGIGEPTSVNPRQRAEVDERGSMMLFAAIAITGLLLGCWALVCAAQQWNARREAYAVAAAAARAGAQGNSSDTRRLGLIDAAQATAHANALLAAAGHSGTITVDGDIVTVTVSVAVHYAFPSPGFPGAVSGSSSADARRGVSGQEG